MLEPELDRGDLRLLRFLHIFTGPCGYVSMTPLRLDLTNEMELAEARKRYPLA